MKRAVAIGLGIGLSLIVLFLLVRAFGLFGVVDESFSRDAPCRAPCWYGIHPGATTGKEALDLLMENLLVEQGSLHRWNEKNGISNITWQSQRKSNNRVYIKDDIVQVISLVPEFNLNLESVTRKLGKPTKVLAAISLSEYSGKKSEILFYYAERGIIVWSEPDSHITDQQIAIEPTMVVARLLYLPNKPLDQMLDTAREFELFTFWAPQYRQLEQDWQGFGKYRYTAP